jgi:hypothetical protein
MVGVVMTRRKGHLDRLHDVGPFTFGISPHGKGGCYEPQVYFIWRRRGWFAPLARRKNPRVIMYTRWQKTLPHLTFATYFRLRRIPGMRVMYRLQQRVVYRVAR